jgi:hydrogenase maturation protein HypF
VALDGTGYGTDGKIWGGEILLADLVSFRRAAHLEYIPLPGGDAAAKSPWRMALAHLDRAYGDALFDLPVPSLKDRDRAKAELIVQMSRKGVNSPLTSSCGRFFDAVSSLLGLRQTVAYEGQAAIEVDMCQRPGETGAYSWDTENEGDQLVLLTSEIIRSVVEDIIKGVGKGVISRRFHHTLIRMFSESCVRIGREHQVNRVVLSGGSFQNETLLTGLGRALRDQGFSVYSHAQIPTNDGGVALGQAVCAGLRFAGVKGAFDQGGEA